MSSKSARTAVCTSVTLTVLALNPSSANVASVCGVVKRVACLNSRTLSHALAALISLRCTLVTRLRYDALSNAVQIVALERAKSASSLDLTALAAAANALSMICASRGSSLGCNTF